MSTKLQMLAYFLKSLSIEHYLVQFEAKTYRQSQNENKFQHNYFIF